MVAFAVLLFGALLGAGFGVVFHALSGGGRDFASVGGMQADSYDVRAEEEVAQAALRRLFEPSSDGKGSSQATSAGHRQSSRHKGTRTQIGGPRDC